MIITDREITKEELEKIYDDFTRMEIADGVPQAERKRFSYTAEENDMVVGFASGLTNHKWFYLSDMWVHEDYRRQGLGTKLLGLLEDKTKTAGIKHIYTWTHGFTNPHFYKKQGYQIFTVFEDFFEIKGYHHTGFRKDLFVNENTRTTLLIETFYDLTRKLNRKFSIIPMLHGSLGLQMLVDDELNPDDIDICIPQHLYRISERWDDLLNFMQSEGYELTDLHERCFRKGDIELEFAAIDGKGCEIPSMEEFAEFDIRDCPIFEVDGAFYRNLTLEQYLAAYLSSQDDEYRKEKTNDKDNPKIEAIRRVLEKEKCCN